MWNEIVSGLQAWSGIIYAGLSVTVRLAVTTLPFGILIGFLVAWLAVSRSRWAQLAGVGYTTVMRGLPEILTLFIVYNGAGLLLNRCTVVLGLETPVEISPFIAGVVALSLVFGAFAAEVLRGGYRALDKGQHEAGLAVGMTRSLIFRRITLPQLWRFALPGLGNLWMNLIKDTSLVSIIALDDLMRATKVAVSVTKQPFRFFLIACLLYWILCLLSGWLLRLLERRANRGIRQVAHV